MIYLGYWHNLFYAKIKQIRSIPIISWNLNTKTDATNIEIVQNSCIKKKK